MNERREAALPFCPLAGATRLCCGGDDDICLFAPTPTAERRGEESDTEMRRGEETFNLFAHACRSLLC